MGALPNEGLIWMRNPDFRSEWVIALSNMTFVVRRHVKRTKRQGPGVVVLDYLGAKHCVQKLQSFGSHNLSCTGNTSLRFFVFSKEAEPGWTGNQGIDALTHIFTPRRHVQRPFSRPANLRGSGGDGALTGQMPRGSRSHGITRQSVKHNNLNKLGEWDYGIEWDEVMRSYCWECW